MKRGEKLPEIRSVHGHEDYGVACQMGENYICGSFLVQRTHIAGICLSIHVCRSLHFWEMSLTLFRSRYWVKYWELCILLQSLWNHLVLFIFCACWVGRYQDCMHFLARAFRRALWTRYRTWEDIKESFWADSTRPAWTLLEEWFPLLQRGQGSNCVVWIWETDAFGEQCIRLKTWDILQSLCALVSSPSRTGAPVEDMYFKTAQWGWPHRYPIWPMKKTGLRGV